MRAFTAIVATLLVLPTLPATAQEACDCRSTAASGRIVALNGDVTVAGPEAVETAAAGTRLGQGSLLFTGAASSADVSFDAGCSVSLGANATLTVGSAEGALCPVISTSSSAFSLPVAGGVAAIGLLPALSSIGTLATPIAGVAGAAIAVGVAEARGGREREISP